MTSGRSDDNDNQQTTATQGSFDADGLRGDWMLYADDEIDVGQMGQAIETAAEIIAKNDAEWSDLRERLQKAQSSLLEMARSAPTANESARLRGKAEGVALASDYVRRYGPPSGRSSE